MPRSIATVRARWLAQGVTGKTANNRLGYLESVYNELHKLDVIDFPCPFSRIKLIRLQERPTKPQIAELLEALRTRDTSTTYLHGRGDLPVYGREMGQGPGLDL